MSINLGDILNSLALNDTSEEVEEEFDYVKVANDLDTVSKSFDRTLQLAKIACFQNNYDVTSFTKEDLTTLEKIGEVLPTPFSEAKESEPIKTSSLAFKSLLKKFAQLDGKNSLDKKAMDLTKEMVRSGTLEAENVLSKYSELKESTLEDLTILEKALELNKKGEILSLGQLSEEKATPASAREDFADYLRSID